MTGCPLEPDSQLAAAEHHPISLGAHRQRATKPAPCQPAAVARPKHPAAPPCANIDAQQVVSSKSVARSAGHFRNPKSIGELKSTVFLEIAALIGCPLFRDIQSEWLSVAIAAPLMYSWPMASQAQHCPMPRNTLAAANAVSSLPPIPTPPVSPPSSRSNVTIVTSSSASGQKAGTELALFGAYRLPVVAESDSSLERDMWVSLDWERATAAGGSGPS